MKSSVEPLEGNKVKLYVEVDEAEFETDIDQAFRTIAQEVKLPGFRNGKVPRKVLEARIGGDAAREQALRDGVPKYLAKAVNEHAVDIVATPDVEITGGQESGDVEFEAEIEVRPVITVPGYNGLRIELEPIELTDEQITEAQQSELKQYGTLVAADRPAQTGDFLTLDLSSHRDGEEVLGLNTEDWSYELGQGWVTDDFDQHLAGAKVGDIIEFSSPPKGTEEPADFKILVKAIQTLELPTLTDEWIAENTGEFETVEEWTKSITAEIRQAQLNTVRREIGPKMSEALAALVDIELPESMVDSEMRQQLQNLSRMLQQQGMDIQSWLQLTQQNPDALLESTRPQAELAVKTDLALRAVADAEGFTATDDDINQEFARMAMQFGRKAKDLRKVYEDNDAMPELVAQIRKQKASDHLLETVDIVDTNGKQIDRDVLFGRDHDDHDHDHDDHDHDHDHGDPETADSAGADNDDSKGADK